MKQIMPGVFTLTGLPIGRVYLISEGDGATLIDASVSIAAGAILRQLDRAGVARDGLRRILITHAHPDHVGALPELIRTTGAEVWEARLERPVIEGTIPVVSSPRRPGQRPQRPLFLGPAPVARELAEGELLPQVLGGLQVLHTPGHAPGHLSFWQPERGLLFCGDVVMHLLGLRLPFRAFTVDMPTNIRSLSRLAGLEPEAVCFGHGPPLVREAAGALRRFARKVGAV